MVLLGGTLREKRGDLKKSFRSEKLGKNLGPVATIGRVSFFFFFLSRFLRPLDHEWEVEARTECGKHGT